MKKILSILCFIRVVLSAQTPNEPPQWADMGLVKKTFVANYKIPRFQTGEKGFQEWIKFELNDYKTIQKLIKNGDLEVSWANYGHNLDIKTSDSTVKYEIERVFKKMPLWYSNWDQWEDISGKDTIFVDDTKKEFYRFLLPDDPFLFKFSLTDSLTYAFHGKSFQDTIQITGGRLGFPKHEKIYPIGNINSVGDMAMDVGKLIKKEVDRRFLLRKTYKILKLKEINIVIKILPDVAINIESTTKRAKRLGKKLEKLIRSHWRSWSLFRGQFILKARLRPDLGVWIYNDRKY